MPEFHHWSLVCPTWQPRSGFYSTHFGFRRARVAPLGGGDQIVFLKSGSFYLELFRTKGAEPRPRPPAGPGPEYPGWRHLTFMVEDVDAKLAAMGADAGSLPGPMDFDAFIPGWSTAWVADPDGSIVELSQGFVDEEHPPET